MSLYASELAHARLNALRTLIDALNEAETPDEKRRCAVAIFNAPDPCDLDDEIDLVDDEDDESEENHDVEHERAPSVSERVDATTPGPSAVPSDDHLAAILPCEGPSLPIVPTPSPSSAPPPPCRSAATVPAVVSRPP